MRMVHIRKKVFFLGIIVLFVWASVIPIINGDHIEVINIKGAQLNGQVFVTEDTINELHTKKTRSILYVGGNGTGNYSTIQSAINNASDGDTVFAYNGIYFENVIINKSITLAGEDRDNTIIDGGGNLNVVSIAENLTFMTGFTVSNGTDGIDIRSNNNTIYCNNINSTINSIRVHNAHFNNISNNNIILNDNGIKCRVGSSNNLIYHNNFVDNGVNAIDEDSNTWDNGYPSSGNYWSDYIGVDIYHGVNQDILGSDGIGDTPYVFSVGSDGYPLMNPWDGISPVPSYDEIFVDDDYNESTSGWNSTHFDKIQNGVDAVDENGTVFVYTGLYNEKVFVGKTINLTGEDRNNTIIDGNGSSDVVTVFADNVNIREFKIQNSGISGYPNYDSGIKLEGNWSLVENNIITGNGRGCWISANNNSIVDNDIISNNHQGVELYTCRDNMVTGNIISSNTRAGIQSDDSSKNTINNNVIISNGWHGIFLDDSSNNNTIIDNNVLDNDIGVCIYEFSDNNIIYHNNLINNTLNAYDECNNIWDNGYPSGGNYWDDYNGTDEDGDGMGDTPYPIIGGSNQDNYPFMYPNLWLIELTANFTYSPENPVNMDLIQFNDTSVAGGTITSWWWDFSDGYYSDLQNPIHIYPTPGFYNVSLTITDNYSRIDTVKISIFVNRSNDPPSIPDISGPRNGTVGVEYEFTFNAVDPEGDDLYYYIDWGDNTSDEWIGANPSGENVTVKHTYSVESVYTIQAKAKDIFDAEGDWGYFEVIMPKSKTFVSKYIPNAKTVI
jgi:parallel beta-helix repeat protein